MWDHYTLSPVFVKMDLPYLCRFRDYKRKVLTFGHNGIHFLKNRYDQAVTEFPKLFLIRNTIAYGNLNPDSFFELIKRYVTAEILICEPGEAWFYLPARSPYREKSSLMSPSCARLHWQEPGYSSFLQSSVFLSSIEIPSDAATITQKARKVMSQFLWINWIIHQYIRIYMSHSTCIHY